MHKVLLLRLLRNRKFLFCIFGAVKKEAKNGGRIDFLLEAELYLALNWNKNMLLASLQTLLLAFDGLGGCLSVFKLLVWPRRPFFKYEFYTFKNAIYDSQIHYKPLGIHIFDLG